MPTEYTVQQGDSLWKIAKANGITVSQLLALNPQYQANPGMIQPGEKVAMSAEPETDKDGKTIESTEVPAPFDPSMYRFEFRGANLAIIDFTDDNSGTLWVFDQGNKEYRPFESIEAVANYFNLNPKDVTDNINELETTVRDAHQDVFEGLWLGPEYQVRSDGTALKEPQTKSNLSGLVGLYGQTKKDSSYEKLAASLISFKLTDLKNSGAISQETFNETVMDDGQLAKYVNAMTYGGYNLADVYRDIKAVELSNQGNAVYNDIKGIHETAPAEQWAKTTDGQKSRADANLMPPMDLAGFDSELFNNPLFQIPAEAFKTLVEPVDWTSPEFKEEAEKIQAAWYDIMMQQAESQTEQDAALAQNQWDTFRKDLEKTYGLRLSADAKSAWGQFQEMTSSFGQRGVGQSGLFNKAMDNYLSDVRSSNEILRETKLDEEQSAHRNHLLTAGTPEEIQDFISKDPQTAKDWGLIPSDETKQFYNIDNLKQLYPDMSDEEIKLVHDTMLDESGNYRSQIYKTMYAKKFDYSTEKTGYQQQMLMAQKAREAEKAGAAFTKIDGLSSHIPEGSIYGDTPGDTTTETPVETFEETIYQDAPQGYKSPNEIGTQDSQSQQQSQSQSETPSYSDYKVQSGDTLSALARKYGTTVDAIQKANAATIKNPDQINAGQTYKMPTMNSLENQKTPEIPVTKNTKVPTNTSNYSLLERDGRKRVVPQSQVDYLTTKRKYKSLGAAPEGSKIGYL